MADQEEERMSAKAKLLIVEDQAILRAGLCSLLNIEPDFKVIGETDNSHDVVRMVKDLTPNLVIIDFNMHGTNGMDTIAEIKAIHPKTRLLVLTQHQTETSIRAALLAGANGYVLKEASNIELIMAVRSVLSGKIFLSPRISEKVINVFLVGSQPIKTQSQWDTLTKREREILKLIAEGHTNRYIAEQLRLSIKTVEKHRSNLMKKLDLHNASALTTFAIGKGLIVTN